jgi:hypothetical protein
VKNTSVFLIKNTGKCIGKNGYCKVLQEKLNHAAFILDSQQLKLCNTMQRSWSLTGSSLIRQQRELYANFAIFTIYPKEHAS